MNYEINNKQDCEGIKCENYILCNEILPLWWIKYNDNYLCNNCYILFGTWGNINKGKGILETIDNIKCPICLENKKGISQPNCNHFLCIDCCKRCYFGDENINEPIFPYPDIENEYYEDEFNLKWEKEYPLIELYNKEYEKWQNDQDEKYDNEEYLRKCPLCRK